MGLLGNLKIRLSAETSDFTAGMNAARRNVQTFERDINRFRNSTLANAVSLGVFAGGLKKSLDVANAYDNAQRQLAATSKLTGVELGFLEAVSKQAQSQFRLSAISANSFTIELSKLASKAGDVGRASAGLAAFLDIGAARGLNAEQTLKAVQQSILGIDEGTDKLFSKNPSVIYAEFAASIHTTAGKLTDAQKAQALLNAAMQDGGKVRGEYQKWLTSSQGQQFLLAQSMEQTYATLGKSLQPALVAVVPVLTKMSEAVATGIHGWEMLGAHMARIPPILKMMFAASTFNRKGFEDARKEYKLMTEAADEMVASIRNIGSGGPVTIPDITTKTLGDGKGAANKFFSDLAEEWENLRHTVVLRGLEVVGTDDAKLEAEKQHALKLLDIEEQHARARHKLGELTDKELAATLKQLNVKRQIAAATKAEMSAAMYGNRQLVAGFARQDMLLSHAIEKEKILNDAGVRRVTTGDTIGQKLKLQLNLSNRIYELQRDALLSDSRLSDEVRDIELQRLELARAREQLQLRANAAVDKELKTLEKQLRARQKQKQALEDLVSIGAQMVGDIANGQRISGANIGASVGAVAGSFIPIPGGQMIGSVAGSLIGGLFDKNKKEQTGTVTHLQAIERAQRETIHAIQQQTDQLLKPENRFLNLPANFTIPHYGGAQLSGTVSQSITDNRSFTININAPTGNAPDIRREVERGLAASIERDLSNRTTETVSARRYGGW